MTELEKYEKVNKVETIQELEDVILSFADENGQIKGRTKTFNANKMATGARGYYNEVIMTPNVVTREYGLRQQLIYLTFYKNKGLGI
jgi:hypothetical protein